MLNKKLINSYIKNHDFKSCITYFNFHNCFRAAIISLLISLLIIIANIFHIISKSMFPDYIIHPAVFLSIIWITIYCILIQRKSTLKHIHYKGLFYMFFMPICYLTCFEFCILISKTSFTNFIIIPYFFLMICFILNLKEFLIAIVPVTLLTIITSAIYSATTFLLYVNIINIMTVSIILLLMNKVKYKLVYHYLRENSELVSIAEDLKKKNEYLATVEKSRTSFFANISHELKTPINVIYSADQLLEQQLSSNTSNKDKTKSYVKLIKQNSFRLIRLINNLLDLTKIEDNVYKINLQNEDIIYVVESIVDSVADFVHSKDIDIIFDTDTEEKMTAIDADKVERIVLNLLSNSIKFTEPGGHIFVTMEDKENNTIIHIKDDGIGMDEETQKKVFDRFFQSDGSLKKNQFCTGIGLSLVKSLVELHNGRIELFSSLGKGTEFILYFPDKLVEENKKSSTSMNSNINGGKVERIEIEFSDIY